MINLGMQTVVHSGKRWFIEVHSGTVHIAGKCFSSVKTGSRHWCTLVDSGGQW